ncbi:MAG: hypothetical protein ABI193_26570 [Minicystis sp.]
MIPRARRVVSALALLVALGALGLACPSKELTIELSDAGLSIVGVACQNHDLSCAGIKLQASCDSSLSCQWDKKTGGCLLREPCVHQGSSDYDAAAFKAIRVALVRSDPFGLEVASTCRALVRATAPGCEKLNLSNAERRHCNTLSVSEAVDRALADGLSFNDFHDPSVAFPVIALYQPKTVPAECVSITDADLDACRNDKLPCADAEIVACAGLSVPINEQAYDLSCASCQNGLHFSLGRDNGSCPQIAGHCFFEACAKLFARADLP